MSVQHRVTCLRELRARKDREAAIQSATALVFQKMAESGGLDDSIIAAHSALFDIWQEGIRHEEGCIRICPKDGELYRCIRTPNQAAKSSKNAPSMAKANWALIDE